MCFGRFFMHFAENGLCAVPYTILPQHYNKTRLPFSVLHLSDSKCKKALDKPCSIVYNDIEINNSYYF